MEENQTTQTSINTETIAEQKIDKDKNILMVTYILMFLGYVSLITWLIAVILSYVKKGDAENEAARSHFGNIITVFWVNFIGGIIGFISIPIFVGWIILLAIFIWTLVRLIKGFIKMNDGKAFA